MAQRAEQVVLTRVPQIECTDADTGTVGDRGDGRLRIGEKDVAGRVEDHSIVADRLAAAAGQAR